MYPEYKLQAYSHIQGQWIDTSHEASNRPHHYHFLHEQYNRYIASATEGASPNQAPIGYRIIRTPTLSLQRYPQVVDCWTNGKVPK